MSRRAPAHKAERAEKRQASADAFRRAVFVDSPAVLAFLDKESLTALFPPAKILAPTLIPELLSNPREVPDYLRHEMNDRIRKQFPEEDKK